MNQVLCNQIARGNHISSIYFPQVRHGASAALGRPPGTRALCFLQCDPPPARLPSFPPLFAIKKIPSSLLRPSQERKSIAKFPRFPLCRPPPLRLLISTSGSLGIKIDANKEECFYDDALAGQRIFFAYQVRTWMASFPNIHRPSVHHIRDL